MFIRTVAQNEVLEHRDEVLGVLVPQEVLQDVLVVVRLGEDLQVVLQIVHYALALLLPESLAEVLCEHPFASLLL